MTHAYKDIVVLLSAADGATARLEAAVTLAQRFEARLTGLDVSPGRAVNGPRAAEVAGLQERFESRLRGTDIIGRYLVADGRAGAAGLAQHAHHADLVVAPTAEAAAAGLALPDVPEELVVAAGVPVLLMPVMAEPKPVGQSIILAWNGSREATRAMHDALPLMAAAREVVVFAFDDRAAMMQGEVERVLDHLGRHGVRAESFTWPDTGEITAIDALFACLSERDTDLIVAGGYGRSRMFEHLFGGASEILVDNLSMPVFMSH